MSASKNRENQTWDILAIPKGSALAYLAWENIQGKPVASLHKKQVLAGRFATCLLPPLHTLENTFFYIAGLAS